MPHYYPVVIPGGKSLAGDSLGFHAYSLRIDNLTNQWLLEETSLAWIPPYSLGVCLRLYGTGVGIILNQAPIGQPQLTPVTGEQAVGVYSDQMRTEVAGSPVRQYSLVQAVNDLTQGPQPALPPVGVDRLWADTQGNIHHIHSNGVDLTLVDSSNVQTTLYPTMDPHYQAMMSATPLGGDLYGPVNNGHIDVKYGSPINMVDSGGTDHNYLLMSGPNLLQLNVGGGAFYWFNQSGSFYLMTLDNVGNLNIHGNGAIPTGSLAIGPGYINQNGDLGVARVSAPTTGAIYFSNSAGGHYIVFTGSSFQFSDGINCTGAFVTAAGSLFLEGTASTHYITKSGPNIIYIATSGGHYMWATNTGVFATVYAAAFSVQSTRTVKDNIVTLDSRECLHQVLDPRSNPVHFTKIGTETEEIGFIAEDLALVVPEVVDFDEKSAPTGVHYGALTATLWGALRGLESRVRNLETA